MSEPLVTIPKFDWDRGVHVDVGVPKRLVEQLLRTMLTSRRWEADEEHFHRLWKKFKEEAYGAAVPIPAQVEELEEDEEVEVVRPALKKGAKAKV